MPPPTSTTSTSGCAATRVAPVVARARRARRRRRPAAPRAARRSGSPAVARRLQRQLARHLVERRRHGEHDVLLGERRGEASRPRRRAGGASDARRRVDRRDARHVVGARPTAGSPRCGRRRRGRATTSPTRRAGPARARPARAPARRRTQSRPVRPRQVEAARPAGRARRRGRGTTAASAAARTSPGATSCGTSKTRIVRPGRACRRRRTPCWWCRGRCRRGSAPPRESARGGSVRLAHVELELPAPRAVARDAPELERADLGHVRAEADRDRAPRRRPSASSVASSGGSSSSSPCSQRSTTVPGRSSRRTDEPKKRNSRRLADDEPELRARAARPRVPSSMPNGATQSAFTGGGMPGHRRHRRLDADVVRARRAAADADAAPAAREPVVRGAVARPRGRGARRRARARRRRRARTTAPRPCASRKRAACITPPLKSTAVAPVGRDLAMAARGTRPGAA